MAFFVFKDLLLFIVDKCVKDENNNTVIRCAIITTSANSAMANIHERMPVILPSEITEVWFDNTLNDISMLKEFLKPYSGDLQFTVVA